MYQNSRMHKPSFINGHLLPVDVARKNWSKFRTKPCINQFLQMKGWDSKMRRGKKRACNYSCSVINKFRASPKNPADQNSLNACSRNTCLMGI